MNTDSPLDDLRPRIDRLLDFFTEPSEEDKYLKDLADDLEKLFELYCHKQVIEARIDEIDRALIMASLPDKTLAGVKRVLRSWREYELRELAELKLKGEKE